MSKGESTRARALPRGGALRSGEGVGAWRGMAWPGIVFRWGKQGHSKRGSSESEVEPEQRRGRHLEVPLDPRRGYEARPPFPPSQVNNSNEGSNGPWGGALET